MTTAEYTGRLVGIAADSFANVGMDSIGATDMRAAQDSFNAGNYGDATLHTMSAFGKAGLTVFGLGSGAVESKATTTVETLAVDTVGRVNVSETIAAARARQVAMLDENVGFNISPTAWDTYPTIGRNGTFLSDRQGVLSYFGDTAGKTKITVNSEIAIQIEKDMGLVPGTLQNGFKVRQITGIKEMQPMSPLEGNQYFLGAGNHLPGGAPEMVINSIPTVDNSLVKTILNVKVIPK